jgi:hypothetical protein
MTKIIIVFATLIVTTLGLLSYQINNPLSDKLTPDQWSDTPVFSPDSKYIAVEYRSDMSRQWEKSLSRRPLVQILDRAFDKIDPIINPRGHTFILNARNYAIVGRIRGFGPYWIDNDTLSCLGPGARLYSVKNKRFLPAQQQMHYFEDNQPFVKHERVVDARTGKIVFDADLNQAYAYLPRGHHLILIEPTLKGTVTTAPQSNLLNIIDLDKGDVKYSQIIKAKPGFACTIDGSQIAYQDDKLRVIDLKEEKEIYSIPLPQRAYTKMEFAKDGKRIALTDDKHAIHFYDLETGTLMCKIQGDDYTEITWLMDDRVTLKEPNKIGIFSLKNGRFLGGESLNTQKSPVISMNARKYFYINANDRVSLRNLSIDPATQSITGWSTASPWVQ